jgi:hypothetical protein
MEVTESFWMFVVVSVLSFLGALLGIMYKSKCSNVDVCCGLLRVQRNVDIEMQEENHRVTDEHKDQTMHSLASAL